MKRIKMLAITAKLWLTKQYNLVSWKLTLWYFKLTCLKPERVIVRPKALIMPPLDWVKAEAKQRARTIVREQGQLKPRVYERRIHDIKHKLVNHFMQFGTWEVCPA